MIDVRYEFFTNEQQQKQMEDIFSYVQYILPHWVQSAVFQLYSSDPDFDTSLMVKCFPSSKSICVTVYTSFLGHPVDTQRTMLIHEFVHTFLHPATGWVRANVLAPVEDRNKELYNYLYDEFTSRVEDVTQEVALSMKQLLDRVEIAEARMIKTGRVTEKDLLTMEKTNE